MRQRGIIFLTVLGLLGCGSGGNKAVVVVTTIPVAADWVKQVGGDKVVVKSLLKGYEEPHSYEPNPKDAQVIAQAQLVVRVGLGLDEWLNGLIANAKNPRLKILTLAEGVEIIEEGEGNGEHRSHGVHEQGNPHIWLDPDVAKMGVKRIALILAEIDPDNSGFYHQKSEGYLRQLDSVQTVLKDMVANLKDRKFVALHNSWPYFCRGFGFEMVQAIEPLPGQEPSAKTVVQLAQRMRRDSVRVIVLEPQQNRDIALALAQEAKAKMVVLSQFNGTRPANKTYLQLLDHNVRMLVQQLSVDK